MLETLVGRNQCSFVHLCRRFSSIQISVVFWQSTHIVVRLERFASSCNKEFHGSVAGCLLGWYTEERDLKLRRLAELNEVSSIARRSLVKSAA